jgi:putative intracellular protease/amidase
MKNFMLLALASLAIVSVLSPVAIAEQNHRVLMIVKANSNSENAELMLTKEVGVMTDMLEQAGFEVEVATASGQPMVVGAANVKSDLKLEDVNVADYSGLIIPCMAAGFQAETPALEAPKAATIVKEAVAEGKPVAAQVASVLILAEAGVLSGKKYAFPTEEEASNRPTLKDAFYSGNGIVQDGNIITSGVCPFAAKNQGLKDGTPALTKAFISALGDKK